MSLDQFDKGASVPRTVTITDGTDPLDTATFLTIEVKVWNWLHRVIGTYTLAAGTVTRLAPTTGGQVFFVVPSATTLVSRALKYFYTIKTTEVDGNYPTGVRTRKFTGWGFKLEASK